MKKRRDPRSQPESSIDRGEKRVIFWWLNNLQHVEQFLLFANFPTVSVALLSVLTLNYTIQWNCFVLSVTGPVCNNPLTAFHIRFLQSFASLQFCVHFLTWRTPTLFWSWFTASSSLDITESLGWWWTLRGDHWVRSIPGSVASAITMQPNRPWSNKYFNWATQARSGDVIRAQETGKIQYGFIDPDLNWTWHYLRLYLIHIVFITVHWPSIN